jgi:hypothetical protein
MKFVTLATFAAAVAAVAAPAAAENYSFSRNGVTYQVVDTVRDGVRVIEGKDSSGAAFAYKVRGNQVSGTYRGAPVFFTVATPKPQKVASR